LIATLKTTEVNMNISPSKSAVITKSVAPLCLALCALLFPIYATAAEESQTMKVAFVLTEGANVIDMAGPWEVFQDTMVGDRMPFQLFTVGESNAPVTMTGGLRVMPNHTFAEAPHPDIVVIGAQRGSRALTEWLRARVRNSRIVMSVCTGAFKLAEAGLLDGKKATTHHEFWDAFAKKFPNVQLERGSRFVQSDDVIYTAGGLTSGIDLALHVIKKFYGREVADRTAAYMEYNHRGDGGGPGNLR
jgi:transcriptional regulator GlxA family with amidase domain